MTMATKKSKPETLSRRNPIPSPTAPAFNFEVLHEYIEQERGHLMDAEAVLECVVIALEEDDRMDASGPCYSSVIRIVRGLVHVTIDRLDSVNVKAAIGRSQSVVYGAGEENESTARDCDGVKEFAAAYVH
jgi:hypothetical protein